MPLEPRTAELVGFVAGSLGWRPDELMGLVEFSFCSYFNWWDRNAHPCERYLPPFLSPLGSLGS